MEIHYCNLFIISVALSYAFINLSIKILVFHTKQNRHMQILYSSLFFCIRKVLNLKTSSFNDDDWEKLCKFAFYENENELFGTFFLNFEIISVIIFHCKWYKISQAKIVKQKEDSKI